MSTVTEVALQFVDQINKHNVEALCQLMTPEHIFIDSLGNRFAGRDTMPPAWEEYFRLFPDYFMEIVEVFYQGNVVMLTGTASGTYCPNAQLIAPNHWQMPAAWRAEIINGAVQQWQVYADNEPVRQIIRTANPTPLG